MASWRELEAQFAEIAASLQDVRLERQWNDRSEEWKLAGSVPLDAAAKFRAAARVAGALLAEPGHQVPAEVAQETDAERRWYRALWLLAGPHDAPLSGLMSHYGGSGGPILVGRVRKPADASALLAQRFQMADPR
jgi:hypothetical protein